MARYWPFLFLALVIGLGTPAGAQPLVAASDRPSADIFLAGSLTSASNARTIYAWDIKFTYPKLAREIGESGHWWTLSPRLEFTANRGTDSNLDRLVVAGNGEIDFFTRDALGPLLPNVIWVNVAGADFDRDRFTKGFTYQTFARLAFRTFGRPSEIDEAGVETRPPLAFLPRLELGFETGTNVQNKLQSDGSGSVARLYLGGTVFQDFGLGWLTFSLTYQLRKPFREEVLFHKAKPGSGITDRLVLTKETRHYIELSPLIRIGSAYFSLRPTYRRGSLPPAFTYVDNELSIAIQVAAKAKAR